eukprot:COSAG03_NODE_4401_length_1565_cov_1.227149_2_plen_39_part_00
MFCVSIIQGVAEIKAGVNAKLSEQLTKLVDPTRLKLHV